MELLLLWMFCFFVLPLLLELCIDILFGRHSG